MAPNSADLTAELVRLAKEVQRRARRNETLAVMSALAGFQPLVVKLVETLAALDEPTDTAADQTCRELQPLGGYL